uniref:Retrovirus-related Pol polyprotein from transposon TNT 1-94 n=1 Tax=Cajanus cajan TaxID=3821 RepID=A0A151RYV1_CAJCA|nr:hypothetical protein KK1_030663 [Cajanus cajan]
MSVDILSSLPKSWNATIIVMSSSSRRNKLKFNGGYDLALSEEIRWRELGESSTSSVLHTKSRGKTLTKGSGCVKYKDKRSRSKNHRNFHNSKIVECWNC